MATTASTQIPAQIPAQQDISVEQSLAVPLEVVDKLFQQLKGTPEEPNLHSHVSSHFTRLWERHAHQIPDLNNTPIERIGSGSLVRFRCMVQNMKGPEYFCRTFCDTDPAGSMQTHTASYQDFVPPSATNNSLMVPDSTFMAEREVLICIPPPGETKWITQLTAPSPPPQPSRSTAKRPLEEADTTMDSATDGDRFARPRPRVAPTPTSTPQQQEATTSNNNNNNNNNSNNNNTVGEDDMDDFDDRGDQDHMSLENMKRCFYPLPNPNILPAVSRAAIVKLYNADTKIRVGDHLELIAILEVGSSYAEMNGDMNDMDMTVPSSIMPRLHCVVAKHSEALGFPAIPAVMPAGSFAEARDTLIRSLQHAFHGDTIAAEYSFLTMLSRVSNRVNGVLVGGTSLNIITGGHAPPLTFGENLEAVASSFLPRVVRCPLSVNILNSVLFGPRMDHSVQQLQTGLLQVCAGTLMIFDETQMREGKLTDSGIKSVQAIQQMVSDQTLSYDFQFYQLSFETDTKPIIISEGKSVFEAAIKVRLVPDPSQAQQSPAGVDAMLPMWRYLASQVHSATFVLSAGVSKSIEDDYVKARQADPTVGQHTLHLWLNLARTLALSHGETELTAERWKELLQLEAARTLRLRSVVA